MELKFNLQTMKYLTALIVLLYMTPACAQKVKRYAPELFPPEVSGAVCGFSHNGRLIYFVREDTLSDKLFIYQAERKGNKWTNEQLLPFSGQHSDMGGRLSPNGNKFYFTSDRPGGSSRQKDEWNIWVATKENESWSTPTPLMEVNSKGSECCPLPMKDGTIIFSGDRGKTQEWAMFQWDGQVETPIEALTYRSGWQWPSTYVEKEKLLLFNSMKRPDTKGRDDIYVSFYKNNGWTTPINLGEPVNTAVYEDGAILSTDGKYLIFNQHETGATPSQVKYVRWGPVLKKLRKTQSNIYSLNR